MMISKHMSTLRRLVGLSLAVGLLAAVGCSDATDLQAERAENAETATQNLGESTTTYAFQGPGAESMPSFQERLTLHLTNRMRKDPAQFGITDMNGNPLPPNPPYIYNHSLAEAGHWQAQHLLTQPCNCPTNPMAGPPAYNSCCEMEKVAGKVRCASDTLECNSERTATEQDRWTLLATGPASISGETWLATNQSPPDDGGTLPSELNGELIASSLGNIPAQASSNAFGVAQFSQSVTPEECREPEDPCLPGTCTNQSTGANLCDDDEMEDNPDCEGVCVSDESCGGVCTENDEPVTCTLPTPPDEEECDPATYPRGYRINVLWGSTPEPQPTVQDGLHMQLGATAGDDNPEGVYGVTPPNQTLFSAHYYDPSGDAQSAKVAIEGQCTDLSVAKKAMGPPPMEGGDPEYIGHRYEATTELGRGCHRYVFSFRDSDGFLYTYPSYGSLGAKIETVTDDGGTTFNVVVPNDDSCPIWQPERPDLSCLPEGDQCVQGETRPCYTGRTNTRGVGICSMGTESCENGRWSGVCSGQTLPEADESCDDDVDNDCNGYINEGCENGGGNNGNNGGGGSGTDSGGCSAPGHAGGPLGPSALLTALLGAALLRRRR
jgi:hypothetical protein